MHTFSQCSPDVSDRRRRSAVLPRLTLAVVAAASLFLFGCTTAPTNSNSSPALNANAGAANTNAAAPAAGAIAVDEPPAYSATMSINVQTTGDASKVKVPPMQFDFARLGADRLWTFKLPQPAGDVTYLEKSGTKYLLIPARRQYVELSPEALGFTLPSLMSPAAMVEQLKARTQYKDLGVETVNGRPANKYSFAGSMDTRTQAGTAQTESVVYVDQNTKLPLRADIVSNTTSGAGARIVTETRDIQLNPDPTRFEIPTAYRKVTSEELKQQVQGFVAALRAFSGLMQQQPGGAAPPPAPPPAADASNANRAAPAANANR